MFEFYNNFIIYLTNGLWRTPHTNYAASINLEMRYVKSQILKNTELISELESLGLSIKELKELNDDYELENLLYNLKQMLIQEYKTTPTFTD